MELNPSSSTLEQILSLEPADLAPEYVLPDEELSKEVSSLFENFEKDYTTQGVEGSVTVNLEKIELNLTQEDKVVRAFRKVFFLKEGRKVKLEKIKKII